MVMNACWMKDAAAVGSVSKRAGAAGISVVDFLKSMGHGVENHAEKIAKKIESLDELLAVRRMQLKKIEIPCKQRKMIMRYTEKYRQNIWRPKIMESS
ncbi:hypothetical protein KP509_13G094500 [Ceratopteris richardii]|uniref:Small ribosomal subunit protein mS41 SAM domain-containing protein n=1 Tax=Ceratopteris richardii TaxID=49495 RepID=A0A8T2TK04_CERRI|nr:hypothetical protein KP509_13G094500 [Ceratopteris richardii]